MTAVALDRLGSTTLEVIVERAAAGDLAAFDRLTELFVDGALRTATAILRSEPDASDAVQETFVAAWRELPKLRDRGQFEPWLTRILVNRCRSLLRHRRVVAVREIALDGDRRLDAETGRRDGRSTTLPPGAGNHRSSEHDAVGEADAIRRAFARLTADARVLIVLHHLEERPVAEIAGVLGVPVGTVKWRLHAARAALERALEMESR